MPARLIPLDSGLGPTIALQRPVLLIGRHPECDVRIDLPEVSRRHCCLALAYDRLMIRDLGSRNGVRVNGRRIDEVRLQPGDEVAIAHLLYRFEDPGAGRPASPSAASPRARKPPAPPEPPELPSDPDSLGIDLIPIDDD